MTAQDQPTPETAPSPEPSTASKGYQITYQDETLCGLCRAVRKWTLATKEEMAARPSSMPWATPSMTRREAAARARTTIKRVDYFETRVAKILSAVEYLDLIAPDQGPWAVEYSAPRGWVARPAKLAVEAE